MVIFPALYSILLYYLVGFNADFERMVIFVLLIVMIYSVSTFYVLAVGAVSPSLMIANIVAPFFSVFNLLFAGFYINVDSIPVYWTPFKYLSFVRYTFEALVVNEFQGLEFDCDDDDYGGEGGCYETGDAVIGSLGFRDVSKYENIYILAGMICGFMIICYLGLRFLNKEK